MQLTRFETLALLPDQPEIIGFAIEVNPSGRVALEEWKLPFETLVDGLPDNFDARLAWHKPKLELGLLILVKTGTESQKRVNFYLKPDPLKIRKRYGVNPYKPKPKA